MIKVSIRNQLGLHARAAANLVNVASRFESDVVLHKGDQSAHAKSIMGLMMLAASPGTQISLSATGVQATAALDAICGLIDAKFEED